MEWIAIVIVIGIVVGFYLNSPEKEYRKILKQLQEEAKESQRIHKVGQVNPVQKFLEEFEKTRNTYIRLKERFKHNSKEKQSIQNDWNDYLDYTKRLNFIVSWAEVADGTKLDELWDEMREIHIKLGEIEKRYKKLLDKYKSS